MTKSKKRLKLIGLFLSFEERNVMSFLWSERGHRPFSDFEENHTQTTAEISPFPKRGGSIYTTYAEQYLKAYVFSRTRLVAREAGKVTERWLEERVRCSSLEFFQV